MPSSTQGGLVTYSTPTLRKIVFGGKDWFSFFVSPHPEAYGVALVCAKFATTLARTYGQAFTLNDYNILYLHLFS